ncbi:HAD family hydrolase [Paenibacillus eucommiae]|uniref:Hydrolase of the HAD superfamily n=1 Tax=Paenibacillus eucommiae TaxID=1355755 RepID=A0ABS4IU29_9BACL|nr:HAD family hydrolase [Paenibacillus eucommiae]MBP1990610.1 putative hydrolase of the HAD superfamily [Paenibacillus eucommiae]
MIRSVIFDLDGTLLDRNKSLIQFITDQYERLIQEFGHVNKEQYLHRFIELDCRGYVWKDKVYQALIEEFQLQLDWNDLLSDYKSGFSSFATPFPNTIELLEILQQQGYKLGMITNGFGDFQASNIAALGIADYFEVILISEFEKLRKPDPAIFLRAAEMLNSSVEQCVYVGDHPTNDVLASKHAGMKGIWKEDTYYEQNFECDGVIRELLELEDMLLQWN